MTVRSVVVVLLFAVLAAFALGGCDLGPDLGEVDRARNEACAASCPGGMKLATSAACECWPVVCTVDRLAVVPTPRGPDGKIRRGAEVGP